MKFLRILTIGFGLVLVIVGLLKLGSDFTRFYISVNGITMSYETYQSPIYTLLVNFLGGFCYIYHGWKTFNFSFAVMPKNNTEILDENQRPELPNELSTSVLFTGYYIIVLTLWNALMAFGFFMYFPYHPMTMVIFCIVGSYTLASTFIPVITVSKNLSINNRIARAHQAVKMAKLAEAIRRRK